MARGRIQPLESAKERETKQVEIDLRMRVQVEKEQHVRRLVQALMQLRLVVAAPADTAALG